MINSIPDALEGIQVSVSLTHEDSESKQCLVDGKPNVNVETMEQSLSSPSLLPSLESTETIGTNHILVDEREILLYQHLSEKVKSEHKDGCEKTKTGYMPTLGTSKLQSQSQSTSWHLSKVVLPLGDIILKEQDKEICIIERKTLTDLLASIKDGRYEEQSYRLLHASNLPPKQIIYILEGIMSHLSMSQKQLVYSSMTSLSLYKGFTIIRTSNVQETAEFILAMTNKIHKNSQHGKFIHTLIEKPAYETLTKRTKKENITNENIMHIMLCQIPGISDVISAVLVSKFKTMSNFLKELETNQHCLDNLQYLCNGKTRKVGIHIKQNIQKYLQ